MAFGDVKGSSVGKRLSLAFNKARLMEELASEQDSNVEVGDFLSELATAIRFRMKAGQTEGDWIEEPERFFTDGRIFGREEAVSAGVKLQVTLCLDASSSMWMNRIMKHAGPSVIAFDRVIRKAMGDLPVGSVTYQPFIFHGTAHAVPASYLNSYVGRVVGSEDQQVWPNYPTSEQVEAAVKAGEVPAGTHRQEFKMSGDDTRIAPLFRAIQQWEQAHGDPNAVRLDLVLTDGVLEEADDVAEATAIQEERNGRLRTVLLNFLPLDQWSDYQLPDRCAQFPVNADNLDSSIRTIVQESIESLFH